MRRIVSIAVLFTVFAFIPLAAQDDGANVYSVSYIEVFDAKYNTYLREVLFPVWDEFVSRGAIVSYHVARQLSGTGEADIWGVTEYPNWDSANDLTTEAYDEVSQIVHGKTWAEANEEYWPLSDIRRLIRTEFYSSLKP